MSLLGQILLDSEVRKQFLDLPNDWNFTTLADEAPFLRQFRNDLQKVIAAARDFWQLMYGAHIRYNCLLQGRHGTTAMRDEFEGEWNEWKAKLASFDWHGWDTGFLWGLAKLHHRRVRPHTIRFVESWIEGIRDDHLVATLDELVTRQERFNKKSRARLNPTAEESVGKWVGIADLNYRLSQATTIIRDIHAGLTASEGNDAGH